MAQRSLNGAKYRLVDGMNGDVIAIGPKLSEVKEAGRLYDRGCEGDWLPYLYEWDAKLNRWTPSTKHLLF